MEVCAGLRQLSWEPDSSWPGAASLAVLGVKTLSGVGICRPQPFLSVQLFLHVHSPWGPQPEPGTTIKTKIMRADFCRAKSWRRQEELSSSPQMEQVIFTTKMKLTDKGRNLLYLVVERSSNVLCLFFNFLSEMSE